MRLIQTVVSDGARSAVEERLREFDAEYVFVDATGGLNEQLLLLPVPAGAVDPVLDALSDAGLDEDGFTVTTEARSAGEGSIESLEERFVEGPKGDEGVSHVRLRERALDLQPKRGTYVALSVLSAIVATAGLLADSAIVVVGAMVIAPFAGSSLSASVGAVIDDEGMLVESVVSQLLGLAVGFVAAVATTFAVRLSAFVLPDLAVTQVGQIAGFSTPSLLALAIAVCAGAAGALALATDLPVSIAGVAIAAAIVPSVATAAIGLVWGEPLLAAGAVALLVVNIVFINVTAYLGLVGLGYRSSVVRTTRDRLALNARTGAYTFLTVLFVVVLVATSAATYQHLAFSNDVNRNVEGVLDEEAYSSLELVEVRTEYAGMGPFSRPESVTVVVSRDAGEEHPDIATDIRDRVRLGTSADVDVGVRFLDVQRASSTESNSLPRQGPNTHERRVAGSVAV